MLLTGCAARGASEVAGAGLRLGDVPLSAPAVVFSAPAVVFSLTTALPDFGTEPDTRVSGSVEVSLAEETEKIEKPEETEKIEKPEKIEKIEKPEKIEKTEKPEKEPKKPTQIQARAIESHGRRIDKIADDAEEVKQVLKDRRAGMTRSEYRRWKKRTRETLISWELAKDRAPELIR